MSLFLIFAVAIYAFIYISSRVTLLRLICGLTQQPVSGALVDKTDVPEGIRTQYELTAEKLYQVGFELSHFEKRSDPSPELDVIHWVMVLRNPTARSFAEISVPANPDITHRVNIHFLSFFSSVDLVSRHLSLSAFNDDNDDVLFNVFKAVDPVEQWESHQTFLVDAKSTGAVSGDCQYPQPSNYSFRLKGSHWRYFKALENQGKLVKDGSDYRIKFRTGISSILSGDKRLQKIEKALPTPADDKPKQAKNDSLEGFAAVQALAHKRSEQLQNKSRFDFRTKSILCLLSFIAFALLFGFVFSWGYLLALVPVLLFHELGHLAAMRLFGYKDLLLLFMPLGAAAIGRESENHKPWQEAVVLLAGPVPGIVLAFAAMLFWPDRPESVEILIYVSLILNYLNLLPIMPLDGGQLMQLALFKRSHVAKLIFKVISTIVFSLGAWIQADPILLTLAALTGYVCLTEIRDWWTVRKHKKDFSALDDIEDIVERAFTAMSDRKDLFAKKSFLVSQMIASKSNNAPRFTTSVAIVIVYIGLMVGPVFVAYGYLHSSEQFGFDEAKLEAEYWNDKIDTETDPGVKVSLMLEASDWVRGENDDVKKKYLAAAADLALVENNEQQYSEAMFGIVTLEYYMDRPDVAISHYWTWRDSSQSIDDNVIEATAMLSGMESPELAYPFAARRLSLAVREEDPWQEFEAYIELAYRHIEQNEKEYTQHFLTKAQQVDLVDENATTHKRTSIANLYLAMGHLERAVAHLKLAYQEEQQDESWFDSTNTAVKLGWLALHREDLTAAARYFKEADAHMTRFRNLRNESIGAAGRLMLGSDGMESLDEDAYWQWEYRLVIASRLNDQQAYDRSLAYLLDFYGDQDQTVEAYLSQSTDDPRLVDEVIKTQLILDVLETPS